MNKKLAQASSPDERRQSRYPGNPAFHSADADYGYLLFGISADNCRFDFRSFLL
jgi:hypothetical protein